MYSPAVTVALKEVIPLTTVAAPVPPVFVTVKVVVPANNTINHCPRG